MPFSTAISVSPPVIFTDTPLLVRRDFKQKSNSSAPMNPTIIFGLVLGILAFCVLTYWIPKKFIPWYRAGKTRTKADTKRVAEQNIWSKIARPILPLRLPHITGIKVVDLEMALDTIGRDVSKSDLPFRNFASQNNERQSCEKEEVKETVLEVPAKLKSHESLSAGCISPDGDSQSSLSMYEERLGDRTAPIVKPPVVLLVRNGIPTLQFKQQGQFRGTFDRHIPLAPLSAYQKINGVFRRAAQPTIHPTAPILDGSNTFPTVADYIYSRGEFAKTPKPLKLSLPTPRQKRARKGAAEYVDHRGSVATVSTGVTEDATTIQVVPARATLMDIPHPRGLEEGVFVVGDIGDEIAE